MWITREAAFSARVLVEFARDLCAIPEQQEFRVGVPGQGRRRSGDDDGRADIPAHGVQRDSNLLSHDVPET